MDEVKNFGADDVSDIRVKSQLKRIEQDAINIFGEDKGAKGLVKDITKRAKKIIGIDELADERANKFIEMCNHVYAKMNTTYIEPLFDLFSKVYVTHSWAWNQMLILDKLYDIVVFRKKEAYLTIIK